MQSSKKTILLSKKGMKELRKEVSKLERKQQQIIKELRELDKTDNHDQRLARIEKLAELEIVENQLRDKELYLSHAKLFPRKRDALMVAIGSVVELIDASGRMVRYQLVDSIEADPSDGRISANSPLGQTLIGRTIQDTVEWGSKFSKNQLTLVRIS
ncbi:MAG TPA: GreA/GreB family elongation factor [Candidatus Saccharibacteria bacterium]|nr:GreA/GreB family elongation factor [Candidatus Saccharibacteria bacterium]HRK94222.1 GreA/GreB family elongation factor [Candidatus Saccharibacteria bacterium]